MLSVIARRQYTHYLENIVTKTRVLAVSTGKKARDVPAKKIRPNISKITSAIRSLTDLSAGSYDASIARLNESGITSKFVSELARALLDAKTSTNDDVDLIYKV